MYRSSKTNIMPENNEKAFIEKNKTAILQEMRGSIGSLQSIISEKLPSVLIEYEESVNPLLTETYMELSMVMGYIVGLFNELQSLEFGIEDDDQANPIGFAAILNEKESR